MDSVFSDNALPQSYINSIIIFCNIAHARERFEWNGGALGGGGGINGSKNSFYIFELLIELLTSLVS